MPRNIIDRRGRRRFLPIRASEPQRRGRAGFLCVTSRCTSRRGGPRHLLHRESVHAPRGARGETRCLSRSPPPACAGPRERGGRINPRRSKQRPITTHRTPSPPASRSQSSCRGTYFAGCSRKDISRQRQHNGSARDDRTPSLGHLLARSPGALDTTSGTPFSSAAPRHHRSRERRRARRSRSSQAPTLVSSDSDTTVGACAGARDGAAGAAEVALAEEEDAALLQSTQTQHLIPRYVGETLALVILGSTAAFARGTSSHTPVSDARVKWGVY